jgi:hypothetical protein
MYAATAFSGKWLLRVDRPAALERDTCLQLIVSTASAPSMTPLPFSS